MANRKPHRDLEGYVCERKSKHPRLPGHIVIFDRTKTNTIDADYRWVVMSLPGTYHVSVKSLSDARRIMQSVADGADTVDLGQDEIVE